MGNRARFGAILAESVRKADEFTLATFNANSIRARLDVVLPWLEAQQPDVLCLQETKVRDEDFPEAAFRDVGWHVVYHGQKSYNGVAILSRTVLEDVGTGLGSANLDSQARLIRARVGSYTVLNAYVPQGKARGSDAFAFKLEWLQTLLQVLHDEYEPGGDLILCGDLNIAPDDRDVYDADRLWGDPCFCAEVQDIYHAILDWGLVDVFRQHHRQGGLYTYFDYRVRNALANGLGWRIDHILATKALAARAASCEIDFEPRRADRPSDHTFLLATFAG